MTEKHTDQIIDNLLADSVKSIDDNGFTDATLRKVHRAQKRNRWIIIAGNILAISMFMLIVPFELIAKVMSEPATTEAMLVLYVLIAILTPILALLIVTED